MDSIKKNLTNIVVIIGLIGSIGAGFTKYGELTTRLSEIEGRSSTDYSAQIAVLEEKVDALENADTSHSHDTSHEHDDTNIKIVQKEIDIIKLDITELKERSKNPLAN